MLNKKWSIILLTLLALVVLGACTTRTVKDEAKPTEALGLKDKARVQSVPTATPGEEEPTPEPEPTEAPEPTAETPAEEPEEAPTCPGCPTCPPCPEETAILPGVITTTGGISDTCQMSGPICDPPGCNGTYLNSGGTVPGNSIARWNNTGVCRLYQTKTVVTGTVHYWHYVHPCPGQHPTLSQIIAEALYITECDILYKEDTTDILWERSAP